MKFASIIAIILSFSLSASVHASTMYIDDTLLVPLRSGEGTGFRIVHKGLPSGTAIEIIEQNKETGYSFVRTKGGTEGYLPTRYLSAEPIAKAKLAKAEKELNQLRTSNKDLNTKLNALQGNFNALEKDHAQTSKTLNANNTELARVKSVSADALNLDRSNRELRESNEELRNQLELLEVENARLKDKSESNMMLIGGALVLLGVILALIVPLLKPSKKNDSWA
ncbi:hypothetical protein A3715_11180 [Oleiphilus sp. HI0009]|uniref:TIGR04211 family SH3 domain-containing protein n=3 Tax=Oleiphilus TaxID=141450 RepID=UPI0007C276DC|nr:MULTISPECIES: TIGR04211 family SH3 domain-containing protein [unclassified Oleiphilus]KZX77775.1 hypothetical protein A3715_11180 [Oleiphilus sp. HI0009]MCH2157388.1 TIGR04211 family SH3 domain-containing protein [Oleiphilaceae bacterium]KZY66485.1 hypothetical protein A3738_06415 [Oleiphilus sp. HI0066]KZY69002.1 hypothetical protein A3739_10030 [Oleiphilus sp. HI0067]KZZ62353.1 hypothetical protein A3762_13390 [Oleiphilus sp. HI0125]